MIADPGYVFIGWDLAQAEGRCVAVFTHDYDLLDLMEEGGIDIHAKLAADMGIFRISYEDLMKRVNSVDDKDTIAERYLSKQCRHAMNYYLTWAGLKKRINKDYLDTGVGVDASMAKILHKAYINLHPNLEGWWEEVYHKLRNDKFLVNDFGRRRNILGRWSKFDHTHRDAIAFRPQSDVADLTTISINKADKELKKIDPTAQCFAHMHVGGFVQVKEECGDEAIEIIKRNMTQEILLGRDSITIPCDVKRGVNWKEMSYV
jgi:DNA polymerase I-like protein with 3'-5' exonuclease and polymerase domains